MVAQVGSLDTYSFLNIPTTARSAGMGGHFISSGVSDLNLVSDNPAVLDSTMDEFATVSYVNYISDVNIGYFSYATYYPGVGTFSGGLEYVGYGEFIRADPNGIQMGVFNASDYVFDISYGRKINTRYAIGATIKWIYSSYDYLNSFGVAFDIGGTYKSINKRVNLAFVINNVGMELKPYFVGDRQDLPFNMQFSSSINLENAPIRFTALVNNLQTWDLTGNQAVDGLPTINSNGNSIATQPSSTLTLDNLFGHFVFGVEILPTDHFYIQVAYNVLRKQELSAQGGGVLNAFSFGIGLRVKRLKFSYAIASYTASGTSHQFTLSTDLKTFRRKNANN